MPLPSTKDRSHISSRVLQVINTPYGLRTQVIPIAIALAENEIPVDIACPAGTRTQSSIPDHPLIRHVELPISRKLFDLEHVRVTFRIRSLIRGRDYSVVHLHGPIPATLGRLAAVATPARTVYHCRGTFYEGGRPLLSERALSAVYPLVERGLARCTDFAFALNEDDARDLHERAGIPIERVRCLGVGAVGIDLEGWWGAGLDPERKLAERRALGVPEERFVVGFAGRFVRLKGVLELWRAFQRLRDAGHDAHLLLLGDVPESERDQTTARVLRTEIAGSGMADRVTMPGYLDDPLPGIAAMDVLALPSYWEPFGMAFSEAGGLGIPVVATRTRGARQAVLHERTGLLVDKYDVDQLAAALERIGGDPSWSRGLGRQAVEHVRREHHRDRVLREILDVYEELLGRPLSRGRP